MDKLANKIIALFDKADMTDPSLAWWVAYLAPAQIRQNIKDFCHNFLEETK